MRKFVGVTNAKYLLAGRHIGLSEERKITMPCKDYKLPNVFCGINALCIYGGLNERYCTACFKKPVRKANGHYVLREVKNNAGN